MTGGVDQRTIPDAPAAHQPPARGAGADAGRDRAQHAGHHVHLGPDRGACTWARSSPTGPPAAVVKSPKVIEAYLGDAFVVPDRCRKPRTGVARASRCRIWKSSTGISRRSGGCRWRSGRGRWSACWAPTAPGRAR
ncbi:MAG: hypothetical protein MZV64_17035 [Ignavibacteriales bacterium]|nr:hypothetical protein [Ignavibacteriales bacterium]